MCTRKVTLASCSLFIAIVALLALAGMASANLPDNRAYEMVSPVEKGGQVFSEHFALPDANGEHVIVDGGVHNSLLSNGVSWMLETRTPAGWNGIQVGPPPGTGASYQEQRETSLVAMSENFSKFAFQTMMSFDPDDVGMSQDIYVREGETGPFAWISGPPAPAVKVPGPQLPNYVNGSCNNAIYCIGNNTMLAGASTDLNDLVWAQRSPLVEPPAALPGSPPDTHAYGYEVYESLGGVDQLVGLVPAGEGVECSQTHGGCVVPRCGAAMGNATYETDTYDVGGSEGFAPVLGSVSKDGAQVIFTSPDPNTAVVPGCTPAEIYARQDESAATIKVSVSQKTNGAGHAGRDPNGPQPKVYAGSGEEDGHIATVFFTSREELTNDANTGSADQGNDLYAYSIATGQLTDLTSDADSTDANGAEVIDFVGAASNGSLVYFTAAGALASGATSGANNLYVHDLGTGKTTFISPGYGVHGTQVAELTFSPEITSEVTSDGKHLLFLSSESLTSYKQEGWSEVYLYDASTNSLTCVSCNSSGSAAVESARLPRRPKGGYFNRPPGTLPIPRAMSDDGEQVFFSSSEQLTPEAQTQYNARGEREQNVYEYSNGRVYLIASRANLLGTTASGNDVLFETVAQLTPGDKDGTLDVYDARVNGGFPVLAAPVCSGSACQGVPAPSPIFATPPSVTFSGVGNFAEAGGAPAVKTEKKVTSKVAKKSKKKPKKGKKAKKKAHKSSKGRK